MGRSRSEVLTEYKASGSITYQSQTATMKGAIAEWDADKEILSLLASSEAITKLDMELASKAESNTPVGNLSQLLTDLILSNESGGGMTAVDIKFAGKKPIAYKIATASRTSSRFGAMTSTEEVRNKVNVSVNTSMYLGMRVNVTFDTQIVHVSQ
ncbi:MAG: hypothetical protein ACK4QL_00490 [Pseudanabaenaceae cyanobacterium]